MTCTSSKLFRSTTLKWSPNPSDGSGNALRGKEIVGSKLVDFPRQTQHHETPRGAEEISPFSEHTSCYLHQPLWLWSPEPALSVPLRNVGNLCEVSCQGWGAWSPINPPCLMREQFIKSEKDTHWKYFSKLGYRVKLELLKTILCLTLCKCFQIVFLSFRRLSYWLDSKLLSPEDVCFSYW